MSLPSLPEPVSQALGSFIDAARAAFGDNLRSLVLFGSAAEGKLRATSDINVLIVLRTLERSELDATDPRGAGSDRPAGDVRAGERASSGGRGVCEQVRRHPAAACCAGRR